jgi:YVTN family beta-propeller protein
MNICGTRTGSRRSTILLGGLIAVLLLAGVWVPTGLAEGIAQAGLASPTGAAKAYVALHDESALAVLDTGANRVLGYVPVPLGPHGLAVTPDGRKVYVGSDQLSTVSVVDTATDRVTAQIEVGLSPYGLAVSGDGRQLLVSVWGANEVVIIDTATDRITGRVSVPRPDRSAISPDGRIAYVGSASPDGPALAIVDLTKPAKIGSVALSHTPSALGFSHDGTRLYFMVTGADSVHVLDPGRNRVVGRIQAGAAPYGLVSIGSAHGGLVVSQARNEVEIVDPARNTLSGTVAVGELPYGIAMSADERTAYVTNEGSSDVSVVDLVDRKVTATIPIDNVGGTPREIVVQPRLNVSPSNADAPTSHIVDIAAASPAVAAGGANSPMWFPGTPGSPGPGQPYLPVSPNDPQPQPIWIFQFPF